MTEEKLLRGKVADILGDYELAISIGKNSSVKPGMTFAVLGNKLIRDPDSRKTLGTYKYDKVEVKVTHVEDNYSVATTISTHGASFPSVLDVFQTSQPKLRSEPKFSTEELDRDVEVGDIVVQSQ